MDQKRNHQENNLIKSDKPFIVKFFDGIYDLTKFLEKHPGGINTLKGLNNNDMTKRFLNAPPHSPAALYLMKEYKIHNEIPIVNEKITETTLLNKNINNNNKNEKKKSIQNGFYKKNSFEKYLSEQTVKEETIDAKEDVVTNNIKQLIDESMEHLVDWNKAMVPQIPKIAEHYEDWVNKPVDRQLRLFNQSYLEKCSKTPWWLVPLFWIPVINYLVYNESILKMQKTLNFTVLLYFIYGIFVWTLVEYSLHRWVFHMKIFNKNPWLSTFHFILHGLHHKVPFDPYRLVFPPLPAVILALIFYPLVCLISQYPQITIAGGIFGYLCYDMTHYYLHYGNPRLWHLYQMKRYHYQHHFVHHNLGFGISSPIWDFVFGTRIYLRKLKYLIQWKL